MLMRETKSVRSLLAVAGLAVPMLFGQAVFAQATAAPTGVANDSTLARLNRAADLLASGKVVAAKSLLANLSVGTNVSMSDAERARCMTLIANANARLKTLSTVEVSLQTAEDCVLKGDLVTAERHASLVTTSPKATNEQTRLATDLLAQVRTAREQMAPSVAAKVDLAQAAFDAGELAQSRALVETIVRSGAPLTPEQRTIVGGLQSGIVRAETERASAGMMQPGVVKKRQPEPAPQPAPQPEPVQPAPQPEPVQPAPQPEPVQPAPQPEPVQPVAQPEPVQPVAQPEPTPTQPSDPVADVRKYESEQLLAEADAAYDQARYAEAAGKYQRALSVYGDLLSAGQRSHATDRIAEARLRMNANVGPGGGLLDQVLGTRQIAHDQAVAEFNNFLAQADAALKGGQATRARDLAAQANLRLHGARENLSDTEFQEMSARVAATRTAIDKEEERIRQGQVVERERQLAAEAARRKSETAAAQSAQISEALDRIRELQKELKYEEALQVVDQILFLDPTNPTALLLKDALTDTVIAREAWRAKRQQEINISGQEIDNMRAVVPPKNILDYPSDWPAISYRRGEPIAFHDTTENRRALATIESKRIPVNFPDTPLTGAVNFLKAVTNLDFDVDYASLEAVGIDRESPINLTLTNVPVRTVLDRIVEKLSPDAASGAAWSINDGVITIASKEMINRNKVLVIYDIRDLLIEVPDYNQAPEFDLQAVLRSSGQQGGSSQSPFRDNQNQNTAARRTLEERTTDLISIITTNVDSEGWQENGGSVGYIQQLQGNLIITQTPANHREIHGLLSKLREARAMQINVETRFLLVSQNFFEQIGVDIDVYFNGRNNQVRTARATRPTTRPSDFFSPDGRVNDTFPQPPSAGANATRTPLPSPLSVIGAPQNSLGLAEGLLAGDFAGDILSSSPAMSVGGQFLDDLQVDFLVKATQVDQRTVTLTAPRLTFTNGQTSNIYVATQIAFVSDLQPVVSESAVGFDPQLATVNEGVRLLVDGTISADRRYVTLNVDASVAKIEGFGTIAVTAVAGGQLVNSEDTQSFIQTPTTTVTRVQTTVTVPDQGTILLGGQRLVTEQEAEAGVPVLSKIPILNRFFSNRVMTKEEQTLLILLKPTVLIQNEEEERNFPGLGDSLRIPGLGG